MVEMRVVIKVALIVLAILYALFALLLWQRTKHKNKILMTIVGKKFNDLTFINLLAAVGLTILIMFL